MAVPSRGVQIQRIAEFLEDSADVERTVKDVATLIVDSIYAMWTVDVSAAPTVPKVGMAFKAPNVTSKVYFVAWIGEEFDGGLDLAWVIDAGADYGTFVPLHSGLWRVITLSSSKGGESLVNKDGWKVGDRLSLMQRAAQFTVIAVGDKAVLMRDDRTGSLQADSNTNLKRYYQKERE